MIRTKRVYNHAAPDGTRRFLVDRVWPRGIKKEALHLDAWLRDVAPSNELRKWFGHDPAKWEEFRRRYAAELHANRAAWQPLLDAAAEGDVTLLYGARDEEHNQAIALKAYLEERLKKD